MKLLWMQSRYGSDVDEESKSMSSGARGVASHLKPKTTKSSCNMLLTAILKYEKDIV